MRFFFQIKHGIVSGGSLNACVSPHTDVNDPLPHSGLARMPVIPEAELHLWTLVILEHSHHDCLWRRDRRINTHGQ